MKKTHELKCWPEYFDAVADGRKAFEVRRNDRDFRKGDELHLLEWLPITQQYTGFDCWVEVTDIWEDVPGLLPGHCAMAVKVIPGVPF